MLRLSPTRIFLGEEDLHYHLKRVYLRQTLYSTGYNTDQTGSDEDEDEYEDDDEDEDDEDDETSIGSQSFSPYALSHYKTSYSDGSSESDSWPLQERWQSNWRTNAAGLSTFAKTVTRGTSLASRIDLEPSGHALVNVPDVKGPIIQRAGNQPRTACYTGSRRHSPDTDTLTSTSLQSDPQVLGEISLNTTGERPRRGFKLPKPHPTVHLSLPFLQKLGGSTYFILYLPSTTLSLILPPPQQQWGIRNSPVHIKRNTNLLVTATKPSQQRKILHTDLSTVPYPSARSVILNPLVRILAQGLHKIQIVETIGMDRAMPRNAAAWRRGARTRNPSWQSFVNEPLFHRRAADHDPQSSSAVPARDSPHRYEPTATREDPGRPVVEVRTDADNQLTSQYADNPKQVRNDGASEERARVHNVVSISSLTPATHSADTQPLQGASVFDEDANCIRGFPRTLNVPVGVPCGHDPFILPVLSVIVRHGCRIMQSSVP
ncbi:hypothetical protein P170DRAFT_123518 [Aspergillus steynii IBT 23096]|uniref:Uncharacterized protein n=1 Tax=Aspergillus steynii IBT 23096 TaxID=1392250 RepID=A0A2I2GJR3_9EURO|nr:uncharacterized protein P170DRAFT_123518 [Aspergillus steynii IBT 23096]PLB53114.1 hypothetical protein P170DRAFT_123518 [Aspergillus steynii IBT 23096]